MTADRDHLGRWQVGCKPGPGSPYARRVAELHAVLRERVSDDKMREVVDKLVALAIAGDVGAIRLVFERTLGRVPEVPVDGVGDDSSLPFALGDLGSADGVLTMQKQTVAAMAAGAITTAQAMAMLNMGELLRRTIETTTLEARVVVLEQARNGYHQ